MTISLDGQKALVTGASSGIGRAVALAMASAGADVLVNYVGADAPAQDVVQTIRQMGRVAEAVKADVSVENDMISMFNRMQNALGGIDILVANAGIQQDAPIAAMALAQWNRVIGVNLSQGR